MLGESNPFTQSERVLELELREIKNIALIINDVYNIDFSELAFSSFKRKLEKVINNYSFASSDELLVKIKTDAVFFNQFLKDISINNTELFRDPSFWRLLRTELKAMTGNKINIWFPTVASGEELYSLCILLKEIGLYDNAHILATDLNQNILDSAKHATYPQRNHETWQSNYERLESGGNLENYFSRPSAFEIQLSSKLLERVTLEPFNIMKDAAPKKYDLVMFRNQLIYYNASLQEKVTNTLSHSLKTRGILAIGFKENIQHNKCYSNFSVISEEEKLYRKLRD